MTLTSNFGPETSTPVPTPKRVPLALATGMISTGWVQAMVGSNGSIDGDTGLVPIPLAADNVKFLRGDGTWQTVAAGGVSAVNTRTGSVTLVATDIPVFIASGGSHAVGTVPDPGSSSGTTKFLREDATWAIPSGGGSNPYAITFETATPSGTALIGGDHTGNQRGTDASDIQKVHTTVAEVASGARAIALGSDNTASGSSAIAIGDTNTAAGGQGIVIGKTSSAAGLKSIAVGNAAVASNSYDVAIGSSSTANGSGYGSCVALGYTAAATTKGIAVGHHSTASGHKAIAIGSDSQATQKQTVALGAQAVANSAYSSYAVCIGAYSAANATSSIVIGHFAGSQNYGTASISIGYQTLAGGVGSIILGGRFMANYRPNTINVSAFHLLPAPLPATSDAIAYGWNYSAAQSCVGTSQIPLTTVNTRRTVAFPQFCALFLDRVSVIAIAANTVTVQPQLRITGGIRTATFTTTTGTVTAGTTVSVPVTDSTGFATGDWVVFETNASRTRQAIPAAAGKLSNVPDGTHVVVDLLTLGVPGSATVTKLTATTDNVLAATATSGLTAVAKRSDLASPNGDGHEVFVIDVSTAATATALTGRVILGGSLVDINPAGRFDYT